VKNKVDDAQSDLALVSIYLIDWFIDWCLAQTWAVFQLYRDGNKFYIIDIAQIFSF
jgi:hypothetical protein